MAAIEVGRVCYSTRGRKAGKKALVIGLSDNNAKILVEDGSKKNCNMRHLFPVEKTIEVKKGSSEKKLLEALRAA